MTPGQHPLADDARCVDCQSFPCVCPRRRQPCSCGGFIVVTGIHEAYIAAAVSGHQRTPRHVEWRKRMGYE